MKYRNDRNIKKINKVRKQINKGRKINQEILKVFVFFVVLFAALIIYISCFLSFDASSVINNSYNKRSEALNKSVTRGAILSSDGTPLAYTDVDYNGNEIRVYPYANAFAHIVGFHTNGMLGIESAYNYYLLTSHASIWDKVVNEFNNTKNTGDSLLTTLDLGLQLYISSILGDNKSAVIVMNPDTGDIYADISKPDFDPNNIDSIWDYITSEDATDTDSGSILLNRSTQGLYTPGSTFKLFTLYEYYLENPDAYQHFTYDCVGTLEVGDTSISCYSGAHGRENLITAFANSCNCAFGTIGTQLNYNKFKTTLSELLFGLNLNLDIPSFKSEFKLKENDSEFDVMATSFGQGDTMVTPIHLAMVMSAIANDGVCMKPNLVKNVINPYGEVTKQFKTSVYKQLFTKENAAILKSYLRAVVTDGTANVVYPGNFVAYGKTGTAEKESETRGDYDHSWFVGWAENNENKIVVSIIIEDMETAGITASYVAKLIFDYYFGY